MERVSCDKSQAQMNDLGQATAVIEHKATLTIDDVKAQLEQMKRGAVEAEVEDQAKSSVYQVSTTQGED